MASRMATYMEVTPASPQKRLQAMGYSMLQLHVASHIALISETSQRKHCLWQTLEFDKQLHHQKGICLGMFLIFVSHMFRPHFEIFSSGSLRISPSRGGRNLACHDALKLLSSC